MHEDDLNLTERSDFDDEDKVMHTFIGRTELTIDKILQQLLVVEVSISTNTLTFKIGVSNK